MRHVGTARLTQVDMSKVPVYSNGLLSWPSLESLIPVVMECLSYFTFGTLGQSAE